MNLFAMKVGRQTRRKGTYCQDAVAFPILTVHLYVVIAPLLDELDHESCLHEPCEHGVQCEYQLISRVRKARSGHLGKDRTAKPMRVAMEELQLQFLKNIDATVSRQSEVRG